MADYSDLMKLEKKAKQPPLSVPSPLPTNTPQPDAGKPANLQADKQVSMQAGKPANPQTDLHASMQAGKPAKPEKYSSYLLGRYKKRLKQIALDTERKEYEVLQEAIEYYFNNIDKKE